MQWPENQCLDEYENWAREQLETVMGTLRITDCKGGPEGMHDFEADLPSGSVAAIEVTATPEPGRRSVEAELEKRGLASLKLQGLTFGWEILLTDRAQVKDATNQRKLRKLLRGLESQGRQSAHELGDYRDHATLSLRRMGISSIYRLSPSRGGTVLIRTGAYSGFGWDGLTINSWLEKFMASDTGMNKLEKLRRAKSSGADERHLVIVLDPFSQPGMGIYLALTAGHERGAADYALPTFEGPEPLTHLWLMPTAESVGKLCWSRNEGWRTKTFPKQ